jgi:plastocyanin
MWKIAFLGAGGLAALVAVSLQPGPAVSVWDAQRATDHPAVESRSSRPLRLAAAAVQEVKIDKFKFGPATLRVPVGTKVVWTNDDEDPHTVTSAADPRLLMSPALDTGQSFSFTFDKPGTYRYFCSIHPHMLGTVIVE